jgi:hypothetical protein
MATGRLELPEEEEVDDVDGEEDVVLVAGAPVLRCSYLCCLWW